LKVRGFSPRIFECVITWVSHGHGGYGIRLGKPRVPKGDSFGFWGPNDTGDTGSTPGKPGSPGDVFVVFLSFPGFLSLTQHHAHNMDLFHNGPRFLSCVLLLDVFAPFQSVILPNETQFFFVPTFN